MVIDQKLLCLVFVSGVLVLANLADVSSAAASSLSRQQDQVARVLGRRGRELIGEGLSGYQYRHEGKHKEQHEVVAMEATTKETAETKAGWVDDDEGAREGLIDSADYSGVAMHSPSPPKRKHPKKP
uniref:Uncharacterized protein n=1 Tax=Oryza rufipogon TaxID=4529 RepID=A0A0E0PF51_ORYRU